jgi:hypothetical protein
MTLNIKERKITSEELKKNLQISGATPKEIQFSLDMNQEELQVTLTLAPNSDPRAVYRLRDYIDERIRELGKKPYPYSLINRPFYPW